MSEIQGHADAGWGAVGDAFQRNFEQHGELGAACCVYLDGRPVVDLWGGVADRRTGRSWNRDTLVVVFSTTKGATAICAHMLAERGELDLDARVANYWPEFGAAGKGDIRVRWLLSHQAGLPVVDVPLTIGDVCAWAPVIRALEKQEPLWEPGTRQAYHALTYGFLIGEVVKRITGKTLGTFFAAEVAAPLQLSSWIGLPDEMEARVAHLDAEQVQPLDLDAVVAAMLAQVPGSIAVPEGAEAMLKEMMADPSSVGVRSHQLGGAFAEGLATDDGGHNSRLVHASEHPGSGMISDARSLARMYAATIGDVGGVRLLRPGTVEKMCVVQSSAPYGIPPELEAFMVEVFPAALSLGFMRPSRPQPLLGPRSFGHGGAGGSLGFADPDSGVGFAYVMNHMAADAPRTANNLVAAVADCIR
jgi:CubicO group peptidase (beta-lactamase class C family)